MKIEFELFPNEDEISLNSMLNVGVISLLFPIQKFKFQLRDLCPNNLNHSRFTIY